MILGTHTSDAEQNYLMIAEVRLPLEDTEMDVRKYDDQKEGVNFCLKIVSNLTF